MVAWCVSLVCCADPSQWRHSESDKDHHSLQSDLLPLPPPGRLSRALLKSASMEDISGGAGGATATPVSRGGRAPPTSDSASSGALGISRMTLRRYNDVVIPLAVSAVFDNWEDY
jgi:hypothetical protein